MFGRIGIRILKMAASGHLKLRKVRSGSVLQKGRIRNRSEHSDSISLLNRTVKMKVKNLILLVRSGFFLECQILIRVEFTPIWRKTSFCWSNPDFFLRVRFWSGWSSPRSEKKLNFYGYFSWGSDFDPGGVHPDSKNK